MNLVRKDIHYYVDRLARGQYYCFPGYSDAEWYCMLGHRLGTTTGLGQIIDKQHGSRLLDVLKCRHLDSRWLFAMPESLWTDVAATRGGEIEEFLSLHKLVPKIYERDSVTDDLARNAGLYPFIKQVRKVRPYIIGPERLHKLTFLNYERHFEIETPNLHLSPGGIGRTVELVIASNPNKVPRVYLISAGVSAPIIIDRLYEHCPDGFYLDCGSIWDAFVGLGKQRQWRADLYANRRQLKLWKMENIYGFKPM